MSRTPLPEVLGRARTIARDVLAAEARAVDAEGRWPERGLRALQQAGLGGLVVPEPWGGLGHGMQTLAQVCEVLGRECASTAICFGMHCVGSAVIAAKATPVQQQRLLEPIAAGTHLTTLSLSEPGSGSHFYIPETTLTTIPEGFLLRGQKSFVTNGGHADSYVVSTRASDPQAAPGDFSCVLVPATAEGVHWGPAWSGAGMRGNSARTLDLQEVRISRDHLLGREGDEIWYVFNVIAPYFLMAMAGTYLGLTANALDEAVAHLGARRYSHTGRAVGQETVVQHRLGTLWAVVERTRLLVYSAAARGDAAAPEALAALCSAKAEVAEAAVTVVNEVLTLVGGKGYSEDSSPLMRHLRDARAAHVMAPTTDVLRTWVGRVLLGLPLLGE